MKFIALMKEVATIQIGNAHDPKKTTPQHTCDGIIKSKYDEKLKEDVTKLLLNASLIPIKGADWDTPVSLINISNPDDEFNEEVPL